MNDLASRIESQRRAVMNAVLPGTRRYHLDALQKLSNEQVRLLTQEDVQFSLGGV